MDIASLEPLAGKVVHEAGRSAVGEHPTHLLRENLRVPETTGRRDVQQLVVWNALPQEEGQARGQLDV